MQCSIALIITFLISSSAFTPITTISRRNSRLDVIPDDSYRQLSSSSVDFSPLNAPLASSKQRIEPTAAKDIMVPYMIPGKSEKEENVGGGEGRSWRDVGRGLLNVRASSPSLSPNKLNSHPRPPTPTTQAPGSISSSLSPKPSSASASSLSTNP